MAAGRRAPERRERAVAGSSTPSGSRTRAAPGRDRGRRSPRAWSGRPGAPTAAALRSRARTRVSGSRADPAALEEREAQRFALSQIALGDLSREGAHPAEVRRALGHADGAARVEHVEDVRALEAVVVG